MPPPKSVALFNAALKSVAPFIVALHTLARAVSIEGDPTRGAKLGRYDGPRAGERVAGACLLLPGAEASVYRPNDQAATPAEQTVVKADKPGAFVSVAPYRGYDVECVERDRKENSRAGEQQHGRVLFRLRHLSALPGS